MSSKPPFALLQAELHLAKQANERMRGLLIEVSEFLDPYVDVRDGEDGPLPNKAMTLKAEVDAEIRRMQ